MSDFSKGAAVLDSAGATARVLGNSAMYLRMLHRFAEDHTSARRAIGDAVARADLALAHRLAHKLAGTAGLIGAHGLHAAAANLEQQLHDTGLAGVAASLHAVEGALDQSLVAIAALLDGEPVEGEDGTAARAGAGDDSAQASLQRLAGLLDLGDGAALDVLEQAGPACESVLGPAAYREVMLAVHAFEFEAALLAIRKAVPAMLAPC